MSETLGALVRRVLGDVAPELDAEAIDPEVDLREGLDLDSVDFLNFVVGLHEETGVDIPERDYPLLATLAGCEAYLSRAGVSTV